MKKDKKKHTKILLGKLHLLYDGQKSFLIIILKNIEIYFLKIILIISIILSCNGKIIL